MLLGDGTGAAGQRGDHLLALCGEGAQLVAGQFPLRLAQCVPEGEQRVHLVGNRPGQQIHRPGGDGGLAQLADGGGELLVARLLGRGDPLGAGGDELGRVDPVQVDGDVFERHTCQA
ncbi:Uncharacterised protein [Mycobacteroides abscessus subsp. abscessus]|nr:Uncharacterised protein [Mycobacteroides abscessus subsp. abscessus]